VPLLQSQLEAGVQRFSVCGIGHASIRKHNYGVWSYGNCFSTIFPSNENSGAVICSILFRREVAPLLNLWPIKVDNSHPLRRRWNSRHRHGRLPDTWAFPSRPRDQKISWRQQPINSCCIETPERNLRYAKCPTLIPPAPFAFPFHTLDKNFLLRPLQFPKPLRHVHSVCHQSSRSC